MVISIKMSRNRLVNIIVPYGTKVFSKSVRNNDVDKSVALHFNAANLSISDIKVCAISGGNDSRKRHEKRLNF